MTDPRYPIGPAPQQGALTPDQRRERIAVSDRLSEELRARAAAQVTLDGLLSLDARHSQPHLAHLDLVAGGPPTP
ncbi:hypothetical protein [Deinococcus radiophilus]|uniref:Uncharacterized protein n=1 Tax=Deinococcus radiophilus TaxID=32062 RepID=A0A3S0I9X2_9DEIO|nr:hypothetical protein [Deinococcus radiophilus]RTR30819.1 hypothetical protein EJ104_00775 [Deinococcus radiophilus]UFA49401.1 hypothetical protein LMT64_05645 [Deinococcus radiophilus]